MSSTARRVSKPVTETAKTDEEQVAEMVREGVPEPIAWSILSTEKGDTVGDIGFVDGRGNRVRAADCEEGRELLEARKDPVGRRKRFLERYEERQKANKQSTP